jgi:hypothetical protein
VDVVSTASWRDSYGRLLPCSVVLTWAKSSKWDGFSFWWGGVGGGNPQPFSKMMYVVHLALISAIIL